MYSQFLEGSFMVAVIWYFHLTWSSLLSSCEHITNMAHGGKFEVFYDPLVLQECLILYMIIFKNYSCMMSCIFVLDMLDPTVGSEYALTYKYKITQNIFELFFAFGIKCQNLSQILFYITLEIVQKNILWNKKLHQSCISFKFLYCKMRRIEFLMRQFLTSIWHLAFV